MNSSRFKRGFVYLLVAFGKIRFQPAKKDG